MGMMLHGHTLPGVEPTAIRFMLRMDTSVCQTSVGLLLLTWLGEVEVYISTLAQERESV